MFFAHLLILQYPDHHQNLISSSLYYSGPVHKISSQSVHNFLSNVHRQTNKQTDRQTDKLTNATKNITSFAKEVINTNYYQLLKYYGQQCTPKTPLSQHIFTVYNVHIGFSCVSQNIKHPLKCWHRIGTRLFLLSLA